MLNHSNRRIRTRMYGGVGGAERRRSPLSRSPSRLLPVEEAAETRTLTGQRLARQNPDGKLLRRVNTDALTRSTSH